MRFSTPSTTLQYLQGPFFFLYWRWWRALQLESKDMGIIPVFKTRARLPAISHGPTETSSLFSIFGKHAWTLRVLVSSSILQDWLDPICFICGLVHVARHVAQTKKSPPGFPYADKIMCSHSVGFTVPSSVGTISFILSGFVPK